MSLGPSPQDARGRLLEAGLSLVRIKGYAATSVQDLCQAAGVTKGAFFHHFGSKEEFAVAAAEYWEEMTSAFFAAAPYHDHADPLDRVLAYIDFRKQILQGPVAEFTCFVGTMLQEAYESAPAIRKACERCISGHAATLERDIAEAMAQRGMSDCGWTAESLALHTQAVLQGAFILAKGRGGPDIAAASADHLRRYIELLFQKTENQGGMP